jgi:hypothetical protein
VINLLLPCDSILYVEWVHFVFFCTPKNSLKLVFHGIIILFIHKKINDYICLIHIVVGMTPPKMQLCSFILPSPCTLFLTSLSTCFRYHLVSPFGFIDPTEKQKRIIKKSINIYMKINIAKLLICYFFVLEYAFYKKICLAIILFK